MDANTPDTDNMNPAPDFQLGPWHVQPALGRMVADGQAVPLTFKSLRVLLLLVEAQGAVLSRRQLLRAAWPDAVVGEESLTRVICDLRQALGDDPTEPRFVETIRKGGYRLIMDVEPIQPGTEIEIQTPDVQPDEPILGFHIRHKRLVFTFGGVLGLSCLIFLVFALTSFHSDSSDVPESPETVVLQGVLLTSHPGHEGFASFSPDGTRVAFCRRENLDSPFDVYVKQPHQTHEIRITETPASETFTTWSPDGTQIAFCRNGDGKTQICTVPSLGGVSRVIFEETGYISGLDWSPDGRQIVFSLGSARGQFSLRLLDPITGDMRILMLPPNGGRGDSWPAFSPDGTQVAFERADPAGRESICCVRLQDGVCTDLGSCSGVLAGLDWLPDGGHLIVAEAQNGGSSLWRLDISSGHRTRMILPWVDVVAPSVSPTDGSLVVAVSEVVRDVFRFDIPDRVGVDTLVQTATIVSTREDMAPCLNPADGQIAYCSNRTGHQQIYLADEDGANPQPVTRFEDLLVTDLSWSPDGRQLLFRATPPDSIPFLGILDPRQGRYDIVQTDGRQVALPIWSADGQSLYTNMFVDDLWSLWKLDLQADRDPQRLYPGFLCLSHECAATGDLYFYRYGVPGLFKLTAEGSEQKVSGFPNTNDVIAYAHAGRQIFSLIRQAETSTLVRFDTQSAGCDTLGILPVVDYGRFAVAADGGSILASSVVRYHRDLLYVDDLNRFPVATLLQE